MDASQPHDSLFRYAFGQPEHAAGVLGHALPTALAAAIDWSTLRGVPGSFVDDELGQHHSDLLFEARWFGGDRLLLYLLFEHLSQEPRRMPLRLVRYQLRIWEQESRDHPETDSLPMILPVVLYHGKAPWRGPLDMAELIALEPDLRGLIPDVLLRQRFVLLDLSHEDGESLRAIAATVLARVTLFLMRHARTARDLRATLGSWAPMLRQVSRSPGREAVRALVRYVESVHEDLDAGELWPLFETTVDPVWGNEMATLEQKVRQAGREEGREEGREQGRTEGRITGQRELLRLLIRDRFGAIPADFDAHLEPLQSEALQRIARRLLSADRIVDLLEEPGTGS